MIINPLPHLSSSTASYTESVIPDIHANLSSLKKTLRHLPATDATILLGDYVHKGTQSIATLEHLKVHYNPRNWIALWGNHDLLFVLSALGSRRAQIKQIELGEATLLLKECGNEDFAEHLRLVGQKLKRSSTAERKKILQDNKHYLRSYANFLAHHQEIQALVAWMCTHLQLLHHSKNGILSIHAGVPVKNKKPLYSVAKLYRLEIKLRAALASRDFNAPIFRLLDSNVQSPLRVRRWLEKIKNPQQFCKRLGVSGIVVGHSSIWSSDLEPHRFPIMRHDMREKGAECSIPSYLVIQNGACTSHFFENNTWQQRLRGAW